jgi:hypothetical protein
MSAVAWTYGPAKDIMPGLDGRLLSLDDARRDEPANPAGVNLKIPLGPWRSL